MMKWPLAKRRVEPQKHLKPRRKSSCYAPVRVSSVVRTWSCIRVRAAMRPCLRGAVSSRRTPASSRSTTRPTCGTARRFEFALDDEIVPFDVFGGARPSSILDAGQFLAIADAHSKVMPATAHHLDRAIAALAEVIKLIPEGADRVPAESVTSPQGRAIYEREPGRFRRARLEAVLGVYRSLRAKL